MGFLQQNFDAIYYILTTLFVIIKIMANIPISEIQTISERIRNDDLFLMSLHDNNTNTYQTAKINGLQLKCCTHLPSSQYLETFNLVEDRMTLRNSTLINYEIQSADNINYYTGFFYEMPVDSYVNVCGSFSIDTLQHYLEIGDGASSRCVQWLGVSYNNNAGLLPLYLGWAGYTETVNGVTVTRNMPSAWNGYAKRGTKFALVSNFATSQLREKFRNYLDNNESYTYLSVFRFSKTT